MLTSCLNQAPRITDLAATLTDPALEEFAETGARGNSVEIELELWHTLTAELRNECRERQTATRGSAPFLGALEQVVHRATQRVAHSSHGAMASV